VIKSKGSEYGGRKMDIDLNKMKAATDLSRFVNDALQDISKGKDPSFRYGCTPSHVTIEYEKQIADALKNFTEVFSNDETFNKVINILVEIKKSNLDGIERHSRRF